MFQAQDWPELAKALSADLRELRLGAHEVMKAFGTLATTASAGNALDAKTKELMALTIGLGALRRLYRLSYQGGPGSGRRP
jgi:alkylhydroperoxidase/carboxymuconolactone decarboxylase family protein YurZ